MNNNQAETLSPLAHHSFKWQRSERIDSLNVTIQEYLHTSTGALHYHILSENLENVFLVAFRTVPMDSTGVAHILEHTVLCGSKNYPVRDPFFMMIRRSLNTFMNAFTSSDWTAYPFASKNKKDFNNLLDVYLDAAFFSRLHELDFAQEGHRVEFEKQDDADSRLVFKGVVYNEMKGAMSSPVSTLWQTLTEHLFPTTTYHYNSGGEPANIPDLTYEQLVGFYKTHYHPSNAVFMTYGDIPAHETQQKIHDQALCQFDRLDEKIVVSDEQRYSNPINIEESYAIEESESKKNRTHIVLGWLLGKSTNLEAQLNAHLLSDVLLGDGASPLRHVLESTDLGSAPSPLCGLEDSNREMVFACGVEGSNPDNAQAVEDLVLGALNDVAENGISQERIESMLHQLELHQREIGGDSYPYGLQLIMNGLSSAIHRGDPVASLNLDPVLEKLRTDIQDPSFIKDLVKKNLLHNPHRVRLTLKPDSKLNSIREQEEKNRLDQIQQSLSAEEKKQIISISEKLAERQAQLDDPEVLPKVGLEDVPAAIQIAEGQQQNIVVPLSYYTQGTNGLVYQQIIIDLPALDEELIEVLPYYTSCLPELGCGQRDYLKTQAWQSSICGGVNAFTSVRGRLDDIQHLNAYFILSSKALAHKHAEMDDLMIETLTKIRFDEIQRIREIIAQDCAHKEQSVTGHGHVLAMSAATSGMSPTAALSYRTRGMAGIRNLKQLNDLLDQPAQLSTLVDKLQTIHQKILGAPRQLLLISENEIKNELLNSIQHHWKHQNAEDTFKPFTLDQVRSQKKLLWTTSTQVNFCAKAYPTVDKSHPDAAALEVLGGFLRNGYLHRVIREQGGAYGGGASHDADSASFRFYSYRDPRLVDTLDDFDASIDWLLNNKHEWRQVEEAILGVIGQMDKPASPAGEAKDAFYNALHGRTSEVRQQFRENVLKVTLNDLRRVGESYLKPENASIGLITNTAASRECSNLGLEVQVL